MTDTPDPIEPSTDVDPDASTPATSDASPLETSDASPTADADASLDLDATAPKTRRRSRARKAPEHPVNATRLVLCCTAADAGTVDLEAGELAVKVRPNLSPAKLEAVLADLGPDAGNLSRTSAPDVPLELADAWARRYARAARPPEE